VQLNNTQTIKALYDQDMGWAQQYGTPLTSQQIAENVSNQPGFQAQLQQGVDAIQKSAAAKGWTGSGAILKELSNLGQGQLNSYYNNMLNQLSTIAGSGQSAANTVAGLQSTLGNNIAGLYSQMGSNSANSMLSGSNSLMNAIIAANQQYKTIPLSSSSSGGGGLGGLGQLAGGIGSLASALSSKEYKIKTRTIPGSEILKKVQDLSLDNWKYNGIDVEHIGPYAEEMKEFFNVGDGQTINLIDCIGVLLGAVKELSSEVTKLKENKSDAR